MERTILIVDDEPQLRKLLVRVMERAKWRVLAAEDGDGAIALVEAHGDALDVALLDVFIPPRGADEVLDRLDGVAPAAGLVMASGDALAGPLQDRVVAKGGVFLRKPFLPDALVDAVERVRPERQDA